MYLVGKIEENPFSINMWKRTLHISYLSFFSIRTEMREKKDAFDNSLMQWITRVLCRAWCLEDTSALPVAQFPIDGNKYRAKNSTLLLRAFFHLSWRGTVRKVSQTAAAEICDTRLYPVPRNRSGSRIDRNSASNQCLRCCRWTIESGLREHHDV